MSELYLTLHRRLNTVADWVELGTAVMKAARERLGLSYESVARQIPVSSKTYERYEKRGRVPRPLLPKIAEVLQLEVEEPERVRVTVPGAEEQLPPGLQEELAEAVHALATVVPRFESIAGRLEVLLNEQEPSQAGQRPRTNG